jgi:hypothetical protein
MAKMIPRHISSDTESSAEIRLFGLLKDQLPDEWIVIHSLNLTAATHTRSRETDFVVISPFGLFCLEAKTGAVRVKDGEWVSGPGGSNPDKDPFEQSFSASASIHKFLEETRPIQRRVLTGSGVLLPDVFFDISSIEMNQALVYDLRSRKAGLLKYIERLADYWFTERTGFGEAVRNNPYDGPEIEAIARALRPNFDLRIPLTSELEAVQEQLISLTDDQYDLLDQIDFGLNPRLMVEGGAGSGKTLCAIEIAKSQSKMGKKVLLTCFNKKLATYIRRGPLKDYTEVKVESFHRLMSKIIETSSSNAVDERSSFKDSDHYFREELPLACMDALNDSIESDHVFDAVIVDEAQDLLTENYILVLGELLREGLEEGRWAFFLDANQSIFESSKGSVSSQLMGYGPSRHRLKYNCRNTTATAKLAYVLSGYKTGIARAEGPELEPIWYRDANHEVRQISNLINRWLSEGIKPYEITILSHRKLERSSLANGLSNNVPFKLFDWTDDEEIPPPDVIKYSTTQSFKGLESKMVIIAGIDYLTHPELLRMPEINHIGVTRSTGITVASISKELRREIQSRVEAAPAVPILEDEPNHYIASLDVEISTESDEPLLDDTNERPLKTLRAFLNTVFRLIQSIMKRTN